MKFIRIILIILLPTLLFMGELVAVDGKNDADSIQTLMIVNNAENGLHKAMKKALEKFGSRVIIYPIKDYKNPKLLKLLERSQLLIFNSNTHEKSALFVRSKKGNTALKKFLSDGGCILFFWQYIWAGDWKKFFTENKIWFAPLERIKPYLPHRHAFKSNLYVPNKKISHLLKEEPNALRGTFGMQNFGLPFPDREGMIRLIVSENNSADVGVTLQEKVLGRGSVIFSTLYLFMETKGRKGMYKDPKDPLARHSMQFLENLVHYIRCKYDIALADRALKAAEKAYGTAAMEAANYLKGRYSERLKSLTDGSVSQTKRNEARQKIKDLLNQLEKGPEWPKMQKEKIPYAKQPPKIDGKLDEGIWQKALVFKGLYPVNTKEHLQKPKTIWKVLWDEKYLYFGFECQDRDIIAPDQERDAEIYNSDCMEMFILPVFRYGLYWELVVNPRGTVFDMLHSKAYKKGIHPGMTGRVEENIKDLKCGSNINGSPDDLTDTDQGYSLEIAVPFSELPGYTRGNKPVAGDQLHLMLVRIDNNKNSPLKVYSVKPLLGWGHNVWNHMPVILENGNDKNKKSEM